MEDPGLAAVGDVGARDHGASAARVSGRTLWPGRAEVSAPEQQARDAPPPGHRWVPGMSPVRRSKPSRDRAAHPAAAAVAITSSAAKRERHSAHGHRVPVIGLSFRWCASVGTHPAGPRQCEFPFAASTPCAGIVASSASFCSPASAGHPGPEACWRSLVCRRPRSSVSGCPDDHRHRAGNARGSMIRIASDVSWQASWRRGFPPARLDEAG